MSLSTQMTIVPAYHGLRRNVHSDAERLPYARDTAGEGRQSLRFWRPRCVMIEVKVIFRREVFCVLK